MRQVPKHYTIIGNGRMATHLCHYFSLLNIPYQQWHRRQPLSKLQSCIQRSTHIIILIPDDAIDTFIEKHIPIGKHVLIHFSGALQSQYAYTAHPLQTFNQDVYELDTYQKIPFMVEAEIPSFNELLPGLNNPYFKIEKKHKPYYHSLCVMANNFTTLLWQKFFDEMKEKFDVSPKILLPFLEQTLTNLKQDYKNALTGPISRNDKNTLHHNLNALKEDSHFDIFEAFIKTYTHKGGELDEHS